MNKYNTRKENNKFICDCPYFIHKKKDCKHILQLREDIIDQQLETPILKKPNLKISAENFLDI